MFQIDSIRYNDLKIEKELNIQNKRSNVENKFSKTNIFHKVFFFSFNQPLVIFIRRY